MTTLAWFAFLLGLLVGFIVGLVVAFGVRGRRSVV